MDFIFTLLQNEAVQAGIVLVALRLIPNEYLVKTCKGVGKALTLAGNKYLGRFYEEVVENTIGVCLRAFLDGLKADNPKE